MVKYLAQCSLLFTSIVVIHTSGCFSHVQYLAPGGHQVAHLTAGKVHQMQQEPDNPQAWSHECTDSNVNLCCLGRKWKIPWCSVKCFMFKYQIPPKTELLKEAQHAIVTLHVFCVLPCLKKKRLQCHCENWCSKRAQKTFDLQNGVRNRRLRPIQFLQEWYQMNHHNNPSIPTRVCFENPLRLSKSNGSRRCRFHPVDGWRP